MRFARIIYQYRYDLSQTPEDDLWPGDGNLGDCMQSLAVENIYGKIGIPESELLHVNRDDIKKYNGEKCALIMQAWFGNYANVFPLPWSEKIFPIFIGFHLSPSRHTRERFLKEGISEKMKPYQPIGCRDRSTRDFLRSIGIRAYFSGCMTLTFDKRSKAPECGKIFIVDVDKRSFEKIPEYIKQNSDCSITHRYYWNGYPVSEEGALAFENHARMVLARYRDEAKLVITSKIHVAMPNIAMGIPVVFISDNIDDERFDVLEGIIPIYSYRDAARVNWNPDPVEISDLKNAIIKNAISQITGKNGNESAGELECIANQLKCIDYLPFGGRFFRSLTNAFSLAKRRKLRILFLNNIIKLKKYFR